MTDNKGCELQAAFWAMSVPFTNYSKRFENLLKGYFIQQVICAVAHFKLEEQASKVMLYETVVNHRAMWNICFVNFFPRDINPVLSMWNFCEIAAILFNCVE